MKLPRSLSPENIAGLFVEASVDFVLAPRISRQRRLPIGWHLKTKTISYWLAASGHAPRRDVALPLHSLTPSAPKRRSFESLLSTSTASSM